MPSGTQRRRSGHCKHRRFVQALPLLVNLNLVSKVKGGLFSKCVCADSVCCLSLILTMKLKFSVHKEQSGEEVVVPGKYWNYEATLKRVEEIQPKGLKQYIHHKQ